MPEFVRSNRRAVTFTLLILFLGTVAWVIALESMRPHGATAQSVVERADATRAKPVDRLAEAEQQSLHRLRRQLLLDDESLAAVGVDEASATSVLQAVRNWNRTRGSALAGRQAEVAQARRDLQAAVTAYHQGGNAMAKTQVRTHQRQLELAQAAERRVLEEAEGVIAGRLTGQAFERWRAGKDNADLPFAHRFTPGLSLEDKRAIKEADKQAKRGVIRAGERRAGVAIRLKSAADATEQRLAQHAEAVRRANASIAPKQANTSQAPAATP